MKSVSKRLKIIAFSTPAKGLERNTVRIRLNVSYRHGTAGLTKTNCVLKEVVDMDLMFFESANKHHFVFHDQTFVEAHLMHMRHSHDIKKLCKNRPEAEAQFNTDQFKVYLARVEPDGVENFFINYGMASLEYNGKLYSLPNVVSLIIPDPTGRMQKISALAALFAE